MRRDTIERLRALNHEFYQTFAARFADKRARLQPGVLRAMEQIPFESTILDLGCGHGTLAETLVAGGHEGTYLGLDLSVEMIALARKAIEIPSVQFAQADLSLSSWQKIVQGVRSSFHPPYDFVLSFASLHHIPGADRRRALADEVFAMIKPGGRWILSVWDFLQSERLRTRILPWDRVGIDSDEVEDGDTLIDWRHGGQGVRYVHHFTPETLEDLGKNAGFKVADTYRMDGESSLLGLYQVWSKV